MGLLLVLLTLLGIGTSLKVGLLHMHGLTGHFDNEKHLKFKEFVENHTDVEVHLIDAFNYGDSFESLTYQVPVILEQVKEIAAGYDKVIAVGHSQGGIIWRGVIEKWEDHNVDTFITLASPQHGVANIPAEILDKFVESQIESEGLKSIIMEMLGKIRGIFRLEFLLEIFKQVILILGHEEESDELIESIFSLAPANYYLDSTNHTLYLENISFFPELNNEKGSDQEKETQKENFLGLRKLVMIGGPQDGLFVPWQSAIFGYFDENGYAGQNVLNMTETTFYKEDLFGLRTLAERGGVEQHVVGNVNHFQFAYNLGIMETIVVPALKEVSENVAN